MADATPPRQMSLIPYPSDSEREIVLRRGNAVVVYDNASRHLSVRAAPEQPIDRTECPYCHRPLRTDTQSGADSHGAEEYWPDGRPQATRRGPFVDPEYFGMLAASQRPSPSASAPGTPISARLAPHAIRSGRSREVSGAGDLPSGAEFVTSGPAGSSQGISSTAFSHGFFRQNFRELKELGRGGFGVVLLLEHIMDGVALGEFACKRIPVGNDHAWLEKTLIEVKLLKKIPHANLVPYHWVWLEDCQPTKFGPSVPCLWILQDYCNGGDLQNYVLQSKDAHDTSQSLHQERLRRRSREELPPVIDLRGPSKLTLDEIFTFFRDITSGLYHLHTKGYIHRDLKPSNCLLQRDDTQTRVLISDFGEVQAAGAKRRNTGATGTISYCAPEVLRKGASQDAFGDFTTKSDIFSLGMIVYFMCFGRLPYSSTDGIDEDSEDVDELRTEISAWQGLNQEARIRVDLPDKLYAFLQRLLSADPDERPTTGEILRTIKAEAGLGDIFSETDDDSPQRFASVDSPSQRPSSQQRRQSSNLVSRFGLSSAGRKRSGEERLQRSPSPIKFDQSRDSEGTRADNTTSAIVVRPRKIDLSSTSPDQMLEPQQSPRLMLPPPPDRPQHSVFSRLLHHPVVIPALRLGLFATKLASLSLPCLPYAANAILLYPLLALAAVDLGLMPFKSRTSILLLGLHLAAVTIAHQQGRLCQDPHALWKAD
ncbi:putative serine/threonine-protein kinase iks1 [Oleoguttula sp. CCFEE 5521]